MKTRIHRIICGIVTQSNELEKTYAFVSALKGMYPCGMVPNYVKEKRAICDALKISRNTCDKYIALALDKQWIKKHQQKHLKLISKDDLSKMYGLQSNVLQALKKDVEFNSLKDLVLEIEKESLNQMGFKQKAAIEVKSRINKNNIECEYAGKSNSNLYEKTNLKKESRRAFQKTNNTTLSSFREKAVNPTITYSCAAFGRHLGKSRATGSRRRQRLAKHLLIKVEPVKAIEVYPYVPTWEEFQQIKDTTTNKSLYYSQLQEKVFERQCSRVTFN